ncbi:hypothetical protein KJ885_05125, partial [Patescibacteria group bacterium]|nr:hypothetical protein [Patescibacteria group bacterium]
MNRHSMRLILRSYIESLFRYNHDASWCDNWICETQDTEMKAALKAVKDIYSKNPDAVGQYHASMERLEKRDYRSELEREVLEVLCNATAAILAEAE